MSRFFPRKKNIGITERTNERSAVTERKSEISNDIRFSYNVMQLALSTIVVLEAAGHIYRIARGARIHAQDKISDYYFCVGLNFVPAAIVFTGSSVLRYSNEIKSPGLSGSRSRYSRVANRRYAKIESSSIKKKFKKIHKKPPAYLRVLQHAAESFYPLALGLQIMQEE